MNRIEVALRFPALVNYYKSSVMLLLVSGLRTMDCAVGKRECERQAACHRQYAGDGFVACMCNDEDLLSIFR